MNPFLINNYLEPEYFCDRQTETKTLIDNLANNSNLDRMGFAPICEIDAAGMASPAEVARIGLEQLPHGPVYNWGQTNDVAGYAPNSPDARRERILKIEAMTARYLSTTP